MYALHNKYVKCMTDEDTSIRLRMSTRDRLKQHGAMGDDYDAVINRMLDEQEKKAKK